MNGPNSDTVEDEGYLLGLVYDASKHRTFLAVGCSGTCDVDLFGAVKWLYKGTQGNSGHLLGRPSL